MPKLSPDRNPTHRRHASGQGLVVLSGQYHYTGIYGTPESDRKYLHEIGEWNARGRKAKISATDLTVGALAQGFAAYAMDRFVKRGEPTSYALTIRLVCRQMIAEYGKTPVGDFGPKTLRSIRLAWTQKDSRAGVRPKCRKSATLYAGIIVEMFKWGVAEELFGSELYSRLKTLEPLSGRDGAIDRPRRLSVPDKPLADFLETTPEPARSILRLMLLTGMRPAEACGMRSRDIDRTESVWIYRVDPEWNKTDHHDRPRVVFLGPKAQAILRPRIKSAGKEGWLFTPSKGPRKTDHYRAKCLYLLVHQRLKIRGLPSWSPNQLRHNALSAIRQALGVESAKSVGGHASVKTTAVYIDPDVANAPDREAARLAALTMG